MAILEWDKVGERLYETGVNKAVLYPMVNNAYPKGVAWNGITSINENPSGADATDLYADNTKYLSMRAAETFGATIEAYMYPDEFAECDGSAAIKPGIYAGQQTRKVFGLSYITVLGNDSEQNEYGEKIHIIYGATASPSSKGYSTINDSPEAITFSWEVSTTPVNVTGFKPTASLVIDSTKVAATKEAAAVIMKKIKDALHGTASTEAYLPLPDEIIALINTQAAG